MLTLILALLVVLWLLGYFTVPYLSFLNTAWTNINGQPVTILHLLIFFVFLGLIGLLPNPFKIVAIILLALWLLSLFGFIVLVASFSQLLLMTAILGLAIYIFGDF